jgi:hypothetical protein
MKSNKVLILTLSSIFLVCVIVLIVIFVLLSVYNKYYYSHAMETVSFGQKAKENPSDKTKIEPFGKVTFLIGRCRIKEGSGTRWEKLSYGQKVYRGDSVRMSFDSKVEITPDNGDKIILEGYHKVRIDNSIISLSRNTSGYGSSKVSNEQEGKISRLSGKDRTTRETTPVSAIRSNKPARNEKEKKEKKPKTRIGD